jgi:hypothetical protein
MIAGEGGGGLGALCVGSLSTLHSQLLLLQIHIKGAFSLIRVSKFLKEIHQERGYVAITYKNWIASKVTM